MFTSSLLSLPSLFPWYYSLLLKTRIVDIFRNSLHVCFCFSQFWTESWANHGSPWYPMASPWYPMASPWISVENHGVRGTPWDPMHWRWKQWCPMVSPWDYTVSLCNSIEYHGVPQCYYVICLFTMECRDHYKSLNSKNKSWFSRSFALCSAHWTL